MIPYEGTKLKYKMSATGAFIPNAHEWDVLFKSESGESVKFTKRNVDGGWELACDREKMGVKPMSDGGWVFLLDTSILGAGPVTAIVTAYIPDEDFDPDRNFEDLDGIRTELRRMYITNVLAL